MSALQVNDNAQVVELVDLKHGWLDHLALEIQPPFVSPRRYAQQISELLDGVLAPV